MIGILAERYGWSPDAVMSMTIDDIIWWVDTTMLVQKKVETWRKH